MAIELWEHQKKAIEMYSKSPYFGLLFDMGLGKTLTAVRIAEAKERPVIIIAPDTLCDQWRDDLLNTDENRITEKNWDVLVCRNKTNKTKKFQKIFKEFLEC